MPARHANSARCRILRELRADEHEFWRLARHRKSRPIVNGEPGGQDRPADRLAKLQREALDRFELELSDMRTTMAAMASCCEQSLTRLRDAQWVPYESTSRLVDDIATGSEAERVEIARLTEELAATRLELERVRAECRAEIEAIREEAARECAEAVASSQRELEEARELANLAVESELNVREELTAMRARNQEIVDAQMLRLIEFKRELEVASAEARARAAAENSGDSGPAQDQTPAAAEPQAPAAAAPAPATAAPELNRHHRAPEFSAIEAVLASSPPVAAWERLGA
jgi:hypothetical protein